MNILNIMPQSIRNALRAFYLRRELEQIDLNEAHFMRTISGCQAEVGKGAARRAAISRELRGLS